MDTRIENAQKGWDTFVKYSAYTVIATVITLALMALFLL